MQHIQQGISLWTLDSCYVISSRSSFSVLVSSVFPSVFLIENIYTLSVVTNFDETFDRKCINLRTFSNFLKFQNARFLDPYFVGRYFLWSHMIIQRTSTGLWYIELVIIFWYSIQAKQPEITPGKWYCWNYLCKYRTFFLLHDYFKVA